MFDHSIKVPRLYKTAAKIYRDLQGNKGSIKQLVYQAKHQNIKALYALVVETHKRRNEIDNLLKRSKLLTKEPRLDPALARILLTELLWGKNRLAGESKPVKTVLAYEQIFKAHLPDEAHNNSIEKASEVHKPRYVRVNTLILSANEAVSGFREEDWNFIAHNDKKDYKGFIEAAKCLNEYDFMVDIHIPDLLLFHPKTQFYNHSAYLEGQIILQDKASCLPAFILNPEPGSTVLDMCAAPGMKTTHLAALMNNVGTIYAVEFDQKRALVLDSMLESTHVTCVKTINRDVLTITDEECPNIEYILVDPSCSGTGIIDRLNIEEHESKDQENRISKLAGFQIKILRHALTKFPSAKRVVYSTCSLNAEENEDVVRQVLETCTTFKLVPAKKFLNNIWLNFGSSDFGNIGKYCLYTRPEIDLTNGFFIAVFERLEEGEENEFFNKHMFKNIKKRNKQKNCDDYDDVQHETATEYTFESKLDSSSKKKKKLKQIHAGQTTDDLLNKEVVQNDEAAIFSGTSKASERNHKDSSKKKSKRKEKTDGDYVSVCLSSNDQMAKYEDANEINSNEHDTCPKKKKKRKYENINQTDDYIIDNTCEKMKNDNGATDLTQAELSCYKDDDSLHIEKKMKKKKIKRITSDMTEFVDNSSQDQQVIECQNKPEKKSKQKDCAKSNRGNADLTLADGDALVVHDDVKVKRKKKKNK